MINWGLCQEREANVIYSTLPRRGRNPTSISRGAERAFGQKPASTKMITINRAGLGGTELNKGYRQAASSLERKAPL